MFNIISEYIDITTILTIIVTTISIVSGLISFFKTKTTYDKHMLEIEDTEISKRLERYKINIDTSSKKDIQRNIFDLMFKNVEELQEYYVISKQQARNSFSASLLICFLGIVVYVFGIISVTFFKSDVSIISLIGGTVVEVISGLFFVLYHEATKQLNIYHQRLCITEKYLIVLQIIKDTEDDNKHADYLVLINSILQDTQLNK